MKKLFCSRFGSRLLAGLALVSTVFAWNGGVALAANTWSPTLLVNTQSHQTIEDGNGVSNVELRFGSTLNETLVFNRSRSRFEFSDDLSVLGNLSGSTLRIDGLAEVHGALSASGAVRTDSNLTINDDADSNNAVLTFGSDSVSEALSWLNSGDRFQFSDDVSVVGDLSGSTLHIDGNANIRGSLSASGTIRTEGALSGATLTVDGALTLRGVAYAAPTAQGASNTYLKNDGAGNLSWATSGASNGSGGALSLHPQYPNAVYMQSGSTAIGTLTQGADTTNKELFYRWTTEEASLQDYWTWIRVKVPKNFSNWTASPIVFRYRTNTTSAANNYFNIRLLDTAGADVAITGGSNITSAVANTWTTATLGNFGGGTFTPDGYITVLIKSASTSAGFADAGFINFNWSTTTP